MSMRSKKQTVASSYPLAAKTASVQVLNQSPFFEEK